MGKDLPKSKRNTRNAKNARKAKEAEIARRYGLMTQMTRVHQLVKIKRALSEGGLYSGMAYELDKPQNKALMPLVNAEIAKQKRFEEAARNRFRNGRDQEASNILKKGLSQHAPESSSSSSSSSAVPVPLSSSSSSNSSAAVEVSMGHPVVVVGATTIPGGGTRRKRRQNLTRRKRHRRR
jgi:hypothetical protein